MLHVTPVPAELENNPVDPALFKDMTSLHFFLFIYFFNVCLLSLSRDGTLPKLTSNTKQQLLFHGCVQAEPGHLHWVTALLAVFVVPSKVCIFLYIH